MTQVKLVVTEESDTRAYTLEASSREKLEWMVEQLKIAKPDAFITTVYEEDMIKGGRNHV